MLVTIVTGSHRSPSQSARIGHYLGKCWQEVSGHACALLDLGHSPLPMWRDVAAEPGLAARWASISDGLARSDGFILISPEYHGLAAPALKNFLLFCNHHELAHKPALLVGVSGGNGGAYPLAELRMAAQKNTHLCFIPEQLVFRHVEQFDPDAGTTVPSADRTRHALVLLARYAEALRGVRGHADYDPGRYAFGM
ncbi:NAD(P)H-dependent FMN reductase [Sphingomonas trueperi]|uniref:NADPH-dependent FMN reductase n=1 Tax=Sphingomonas trueperi TaxID=53317 RepID=UPI0033966080